MCLLCQQFFVDLCNVLSQLVTFTNTEIIIDPVGVKYPWKHR